MTKLKYFQLILCFLLLSCSKDEAPATDATATHPVTIQLITGQSQTRASGDPGIDDRLPATTHLYAWACYQTAGGYKVEYKHLKETGWESVFPTAGKETKDIHYTTSELEFSLMGMVEGDNAGKVFVIASNIPLTTAMIESVNAATGADENSDYCISPELTDNPLTSVAGAVMDLTAFISPATPFSSDPLRDLYSNPNGDTQQDANGLASGIIKKVGNDITIGTIRLYHCAAKVDFTWEVDEGLQTTTNVASITCTDLPSKLKVFEPTNNPTGTATATITTNPGNQWIGRECVYVLQPTADNKKVNYTVAFAGSDNRSSKSATTQPAASVIFTTWYRIVAEVK